MIPAAITRIYGSHREPPQQLSVAEVAMMLGVSRATVYRLVHAGHLPGIRVGRSVRVSREAVEKFIRDAALGGPDTGAEPEPPAHRREPQL